MWVSCLCKSYWYTSHYVFIFSPPNCAFNFYPTFPLHLLTERVVASSWSHNHKVTLKLLYSLLVLPWTPQPQGMRFPPTHTNWGSLEVDPSLVTLPEDNTPHRIPWPCETQAEDPAKSHPDSWPIETGTMFEAVQCVVICYTATANWYNFP